MYIQPVKVKSVLGLIARRGPHTINSIRYKLNPPSDVLGKNIIDILMIQETKIDESFTITQFGVDGFTVYRNDNTEHAGDLMMFVRSDIAQIRRYDLEITNCVSGRIESIAIQLIVDYQYL